MLWRVVSRLTPAGVFPFSESNRYDKPPQEQKPITTGTERLKNMFNMEDEISMELNMTMQSCMTGAFVGAVYGGVIDSREAYINFIENNQASIFKSNFDAQKKLQTQVTLAFARGAYRIGWRIGLFSGMFSLISTSISVYRDKTSVLEYTVAGAVAGALYKANLGLAASVVAAGVGAALATIAGVAIVSILALSGFTMDDIRRALRDLSALREYRFNQAKEKASAVVHDSVTDHHDAILQQYGEKKLEDL